MNLKLLRSKVEGAVRYCTKRKLTKTELQYHQMLIVVQFA